MSLRELLANKLETQVEYWKRQIDSLKAEAAEKEAKAEDDRAEARIQKEFAERIESLEASLEHGRRELKELRDAGEQRLNELRQRIERWLDDD